MQRKERGTECGGRKDATVAMNLLVSSMFVTHDAHQKQTLLGLKSRIMIFIIYIFHTYITLVFRCLCSVRRNVGQDVGFDNNLTKKAFDTIT